MHFSHAELEPRCSLASNAQLTATGSGELYLVSGSATFISSEFVQQCHPTKGFTVLETVIRINLVTRDRAL